MDYELIFRYATTEDEIEAYEIMMLIVAYFLNVYDTARKELAENSDIDLTAADDETTRNEYTLYVMDLVVGMRDRILKEQEKLQDLTEAEYTLRLNEIITINYDRLEITETNNAMQLGQLEAAATAREQNSAIKIYKRWVSRLDTKTCELCKAMHGTVKPIDEPFLVNGQVIELTDGKEFVYKYIERLVAIVHPNDRCRIEFFIEY